jgi:hypothetical protein
MAMDGLPRVEHMHAEFMTWAISQGVEINGVAPARFPGRGLGMIADRTVNKGEIMVAVPLTAMFTVDCIPPSFVNKFTNGISMHGLIAAFLTHGDPGHLKRFELWRKVWPSRREFEEGMPALWLNIFEGPTPKFRGHGHSQQAVFLHSIRDCGISCVEREY